MKRSLVICLTTVLLLSTAHRAPAPISEMPDTTAAPKPKRETTPRSTPKPVQRQRIVVHASEFVRPLNVALGGWATSNFGADVLLNGPPYSYRPNAAEWELSAARGGRYRLKIEYAAQEARPCRIILNGRVAIENAMNAPTGCWEQPCQQLLNQGAVTLKDGENVMRVERNSVFPHIRQFIFEPIE